MPAVHIRNVPEPVVAALKRRAAARGRSMQRELCSLLEEAARDAPPEDAVPALSLVMAQGDTGGTWRREEIYGTDGDDG